MLFGLMFFRNKKKKSRYLYTGSFDVWCFRIPELLVQCNDRHLYDPHGIDRNIIDGGILESIMTLEIDGIRTCRNITYHVPAIPVWNRI
jgi:hypothetical protein